MNVGVISVEIKLSGGLIHTTAMSEWEELVCALAGPLGSGLLGVLLLWLWPMGCVVTFGLAVLNMLPMLPLDGGRILRVCLKLLIPRWSERVMRWCTFVVAGGMMLGACWFAVWTQAGIWPIFAALVLLWRVGEPEK